MTPANVLVTNLAKRLGRDQAIRDVSLRVQGNVVALLGANGAGKTTLLRCLATALQPDDGQVLIDGLDPSFVADRTEIRRRIGYQPQHTGANDRARLFDVVDYLAVLKQLGSERARRLEVFRVLEHVGLANQAADLVGSLSGGMRQRLGLAQALLGDPSLLLLDEPAAGLDPDQRIKLRTIIADSNATIIVSTHLTDEAATISDHLLVLDEGRVVFDGSRAQLTGLAAGRVWVTNSAPTNPLRAVWRLPDGRYRCLGEPPPGAQPTEPTVEDGYLLSVQQR